MSTKWWKRLAGCIAIELLAAATAIAADSEYRAGTAALGGAAALALEDRGGARIVIVQGDFAVTRSVTDLVAAQLMKAYELPREAIIIRGGGKGTARPDELALAAAAAMGALAPAAVRFDGAVLSVVDADERCRASIAAGGALRFGGCTAGDRVRSPLRAAFRTVEPARGLQQRGQTPPSFAVQAIAFGKEATILALGGDIAPERYRAPRRIVMSFANDAAAPPDTPEVAAAVRDLLKRVGR
jgi:hypothetical protein